MNRPRLALLFVLVNQVAPAGGPLQVLRTTPASPADALDAVTITFDRPVAGGLDATVDPRGIFSITPAVRGLVEWRDPVTLRFTPDDPLQSGARYTVTVASSFEAMDGSRLEEPYSYSFDVSPPRVLAGSPVGEYRAPEYLDSLPVFSLLVNTPVDVGALAAGVRVRLGTFCGGRDVGVRPVGEARTVDEQSVRDFGYVAYRSSPRPGDADLRRIVDVVPRSPLPPDCADTLVVARFASGASDSLRWAFKTRGPFRVAGVACNSSLRLCPTGPAQVVFTTPVSGADILRHVRIEPATPITVADTTDLRSRWTLLATLAPRRQYTIVVDSTLADAFGRRIDGSVVRSFATTGYAPTVSYEYGSMLVEREGLGTLAVQHVNVDALELTTVPVPDSLEARFLAERWGWYRPWLDVLPLAQRDTLAVTGGGDEVMITGVKLPLRGRVADGGTLLAVKVSSPALDSATQATRPIALIQVTDLAVTARVGVDDAVIWVTGVHDGAPRPRAAVTLHDDKGRVLATGRTDARGIATLHGFHTYEDPCEGWRCNSFEGYVAASLADDRAVVGISAYDPDLSPWRFDVYSAYGEQRATVAAAVFTERGIYRPGEEVHAKAIVRRGALGALAAPRGDSLRWLFNDRENAVLRDTVVGLSDFGTADERIVLPSDLPLGYYRVHAQVLRQGQWRTEASAYYQVAEYRPPEFLVDVTGQDEARMAGDSADFRVSARYLFGAPMGRAPVRWTVQLLPVSPWALRIPGADEYRVGEAWNWWDRSEAYPGVIASGGDTLDLTGAWETRIALPAPQAGRSARATFTAVVTDANRQIGSASASLIVHPAAFYIGARPTGDQYFWTAGTPVGIDIIAVEPGGRRVEGVSVSGTVVRREWHRVRRQRDGSVQEVGEWVADTVAHCSVRTGAEPTSCAFTPPSGGSYRVELEARDSAGRQIRTSLNRWASGDGWVPWNDESRFKMDVIPDRERYVVGDTASLLIASPFTDAEAWVTVERERVIEERRIRLTAGATTLRFPITEAFAPNVFVGVVVVRGRSAPPGPLDDPGRPTLRVGYAELRVTPEVKRLAVEVKPAQEEYRPGEEATFALSVRDGDGHGQRAEVTLWAVDEGVLALTGYTTPDPIDLVYPPRGLGMRLASNLVSVAPQIPEGQKGSREPGGGGGADQTGIMRSRFKSTAFFLGSVVTDAEGTATARARLPDNVTTFRVMAVAVTEGDRYGSGESEILVTRPLLVRAALPRFVREGDRIHAGVVVNTRLAGTPKVDVEARTEGIELRGDRTQSTTLQAGRGAEVRFDFRALAGDSARFRFTASSGGERDGVSVAVPVRPNFYPLVSAVSGVVRDTATAVISLQQNVDPRRSRVDITFGSSPLTAIRSAARTLRAYPWWCTEQISSAALPLVALLRADSLHPGEGWAPASARADVEEAVRTLVRRQRTDGGIGYWGSADWSSPWLSAFAGRVLLEARDAGIPVPDTVFARLGDYMARALHQGGMTQRSAVSAWWIGNQAGMLGEQLAAADLLSRLDRPDIPVENTLLGQASRLRWEDRILLAQLLARRGEEETARVLIDNAARDVKVEGTNVVLPDSAGRRYYFGSRMRPAARLLEGLLTLEEASPLVGPLVETLVTAGRVDIAWRRNTQDHAFTVLALARYEEHQRGMPSTRVRASARGRTLLDVDVEGGVTADTSMSLDGMVESRPGGPGLQVSLTAGGGAPIFYFVTVHEAPEGVQLTPVDRGIRVERWYESLTTGGPVVAVDEGEVVRVRLRLTVPSRRSFVVLDDPLPAGLEPVDLSLRTLSGFGSVVEDQDAIQRRTGWYYGSWDSGMWSAFDHKELRDDRVVYAATMLWPGRYDATYLARATSAGTFLYPPAHAEEMYNPGVNGRTGGGEFTVRAVGR